MASRRIGGVDLELQTKCQLASQEDQIVKCFMTLGKTYFFMKILNGKTKPVIQIVIVDVIWRLATVSLCNTSSPPPPRLRKDKATIYNSLNYLKRMLILAEDSKDLSQQQKTKSICSKQVCLKKLLPQ